MARHQHRQMPNFNCDQNAPLVDPALESSYNPGFEQRRGFRPKQNSFSARKKWDKKRDNNDIGIMEEHHSRNNSIYRWLAPEDPYGESSRAPAPVRAPYTLRPLTAADCWASSVDPNYLPPGSVVSPSDSNDAFFAKIPATPSAATPSAYATAFDQDFNQEAKNSNTSRFMPEPVVHGRRVPHKPRIEGPGVGGFGPGPIPISAPPFITGWDNGVQSPMTAEPQHQPQLVREPEPNQEFDVSTLELEPFRFDPKAPEFVPRKRVKSPSLGMIVTG